MVTRRQVHSFRNVARGGDINDDRSSHGEVDKAPAIGAAHLGPIVSFAPTMGLAAASSTVTFSFSCGPDEWSGAHAAAYTDTNTTAKKRRKNIAVVTDQYNGARSL